MTVDSILQKLYSDPAEVEKMAQEQYQLKQDASDAEKVANEAGYDISQMSDQEKAQLFQALSQQLAMLEGQGGEMAGRPDAPQQPVIEPQVAASQQAAPISEEFQMKVAENMYFGEQFGQVAAHKFAESVLPILDEMRKLAGLFGRKDQGEDDKKEDKGEKKEDKGAFEALAKSKAEEIKKEAMKKVAFDQLVEQRAREILAGK